MVWRFAHLAAPPPPAGGQRAACWRPEYDPPGDWELGRFLRALYGMLREERNVEQVIELDAGLGHGDKSIEQLRWDKVRNDPRASAEDRVRARLAYMEYQRREAQRMTSRGR